MQLARAQGSFVTGTTSSGNVALVASLNCLPLLNEHGSYLAIAGTLADLFTLPRGTKKSIGGPAPDNLNDVRELVRRADEGAFRPLVDRVYPFSEMPAAHPYVATGRKRGSVVVMVSQGPNNRDA